MKPGAVARSARVVVAGLCLLAACGGKQGDAERPVLVPKAKIVVFGTLSVTKDSDGGPQAATLTTKDGETYNILLDEVGGPLAFQFDGQEVQVEAGVATKNGKKWLAVIDYYKPVEEEADDE